MYNIPNDEKTRPFLVRQEILDWSQEKCRYRTFAKDEKIPARPQILYLVHQGTVRLMANARFSVTSNSKEKSNRSDRHGVSCLSFVGKGQPFEVMSESICETNAYAHTDRTSVLWMYWHELDNWPNFRLETLKAFRYQQQRKLLAIAALSQHRTLDRLYGFLTLLIEENGVAYLKKSKSNRSKSNQVSNQVYGYYLPWTMTHAEIANAIGSTRVTVTRLMEELSDLGLIDIYQNHYICLPPTTHSDERS